MKKTKGITALEGDLSGERDGRVGQRRDRQRVN